MKIDGLWTLDIKHHQDNRGSFAEIYRETFADGYDLSDTQLNHSHSQKDVLRGFHYHRNQFDYWYFVSGFAQVAFADLRSKSPTFKNIEHFIVTNNQGIFIPPMVAHGFLALSDVDLLYVVNQYYNPDDELGLFYNDPDLHIPWYSSKPIVSGRDLKNPKLNEVLVINEQ